MTGGVQAFCGIMGLAWAPSSLQSLVIPVARTVPWIPLW